VQSRNVFVYLFLIRSGRPRQWHYGYYAQNGRYSINTVIWSHSIIQTKVMAKNHFGVGLVAAILKFKTAARERFLSGTRPEINRHIQ
jgi:hypothetical protein